MNQQSTLQNIYSRSFPANNLLEISLVKDTNPELAFYKNKHFMFLSLTPGGQNDQGQRTFNKDGRITLKVEAEKVKALANSLRAYARGQGQMGQFAVFADSSKSSYGGGGTYKTVFVSEFTQQGQQQGPEQKKIALSFKTGQNKPIGVFWAPAEALAVADIFDFIADKSLELEFQSGGQQVGKVNGQQYTNPAAQGPVQGQQAPPQQSNYGQMQIDEPPF